MKYKGGEAGSIVLYALTIFLSAFLLFQVQPLIGKHILPWFGGTPAVWTTCLLFFQILLLVGYAYAHWLASLKNQRSQGVIHLCLLAATFFLLPIIPAETWKPDGSENPILRILALLTVTVGGPYFMLTTTGPLLQAWFALIHKGRSPYRLYALSNAGSLLGLISYPFLFEPLLARQTQAITWSVSYALFIFVCGLCAWQIGRSRGLSMITTALATPSDLVSEPAAPAGPISNKGISLASLSACDDESIYLQREEADLADKEQGTPKVRDMIAWLALSGCGSLFLLSTTNQVTQNVAVVPFLWVLFLSIYLLTFIIAFDGKDIYRRWWCIPLLLLLSFIVAKNLSGSFDISFKWQIAIYAGALFAGCMTCHGELARMKPAPKHLTLFFLIISAGGAMGGIFVAIAAPFIFAGYWEYHLSLAASSLIVMAILYMDSTSPLFKGRRLWAWSGILFITFLIGTNLIDSVRNNREDALALSRNFYGILKIEEFIDDNMGRIRQMHHGKVLHGKAYENPPWRGKATAYYGPGTGVWLAINHHPRRLQGQSMHMGVIGLGTGTVAVLGNKNDSMRFYEINPDVITMSREWFWYERDSPAEIETVLGDARIALEHELSGGQKQNFDILVADAFSGDLIPTHLLTSESVELYRRHLKDDGILAIHISNNNFNLVPVARGLAEVIGWKAVLIDSKDRLEDATWAATWVLITANRSFLENSEVKKAAQFLTDNNSKSLSWTDNYASLFHVLNW